MESNRSGRSTSRATLSAPFTFLETSCFSLTRWREMKAVSELEKKADSIRQTASKTR